MAIDLTRFRGVFFEEAREHLEELEAGLLRLDAGRIDPELLNTVFRAAHSIKGSAGMFGLTEVVRFAHALEGVLERLRAGELPPSRPLVDLLLRGSDLLAQLVTAAETDAPAPEDAPRALAELEQAAAVQDPAPGAAAPGPSPGTRAFRISIAPHEDMLRRGADPLLLLRDLSELGTIEDLVLDRSALPPLGELDPELCYLRWSLRLVTDATREAVLDVFAFVQDECDLGVEAEAACAPAATSAPAPARSHGAPPAAAQRTAGPRPPHEAAASIRVSTERVDELVNLVGELVISQAMIRQALEVYGEGAFPLMEEAVATLDRNVRDLQERVLSVRMLPVESLFSRFHRVVRDVAAACGKDAALETHGEDTELDKGVIERMVDPLTHLVRNAVDHGIEPPAERRERGKPEQGTIRLSAWHESGSVIIEVADDGAGLDRERILAKALEGGLIPTDVVPSDEQIDALIFHPGFSTASQVSDISGRGVGMDVVKRNVESLNGTVGVASTPGAGSAFRVRVPLTMAILDGMQLRVGAQVFVLPLLSIVESLRPTADAVQTVLGRGEVVRVHGEALPLVRLADLLGIHGAVTDPTRALVVIIENEGRRIGLLADELLDETQIVIKTLEANFRRVDGIMGATILGDGRVAMILDIGGLTRLALHGGAAGDSPADLLAPASVA